MRRSLPARSEGKGPSLTLRAGNYPHSRRQSQPRRGGIALGGGRQVEQRRQRREYRVAFDSADALGRAGEVYQRRQVGRVLATAGDAHGFVGRGEEQLMTRPGGAV